MVSVLKAFIKNIHGASPRMKIMKVHRWRHVGELFQWGNCSSMATTIAVDIYIDCMLCDKGPKGLGDCLRPLCLSMKEHG